MNCMVKKQWAHFQQSRTGAAMLMVLLVMVFVVIMGSSVMFTSYNSYMMRLVERSGVDTFYTTEELTDLVRVNVQEAASEALETAYTRVMAEYAFIQADCFYDDVLVQEAAQLKFNEYFIEELTKVTVPSADGTGEVLLFQLDSSVNLSTEIAATSPNITGSYSTNALQEMLPDVDGSVGVSGMSGYDSADGTAGALSGTYFDNGTLDGSGNPTSTTTGSAGNFYYTYGDDGYPRLVLEYVTVGFVTDKDSDSNTYGYETNITTDIIIEMPIFTHTGDTHLGFTGNSVSVGEKNEDAIPFDGASSIGRYWVKHSSVSTTDDFLVTGDLYGGTFYIFNGSGSTVDSTKINFSHTDGRLITKYGDVIVDDQEINDHYITATGLTDGEKYVTLDGIGIYNGTKLITTGDSQVWTNSMTVDNGSDLILSGDSETYFKKDIKIHGGAEQGTNNQILNNTSNVELGGNIVGFSKGSTAATSSAITINGGDVVLDMSNMKKIILGGSAYLEVGRTGAYIDGVLDNTYEYYMGQSIAATPDALAYLVPTEALVADFEITSNPFMVSGTNAKDAFNAVTIDLTALPVSGMGTRLVASKDDKNNTVYAPKVISRNYSVDGVTYFLIYYFYDFVDDKAQTAYFQEYAQKSGGISDFQNNLELFVDFGDGVNLDSKNLVTDGAFYYLETEKNGSQNLVVTNSSDTGDLSSYDTEFYNASITLWPNMAPNSNYKATVYDHTKDGNQTNIQSYATVSDYLAAEAAGSTDKEKATIIDNPFDYYVNFHGDNLKVDSAYSGKNLDPSLVDEDSIWHYFKDVSDTKVEDDYTRHGFRGYINGHSEKGVGGEELSHHFLAAGIAYEFYLGGPNSPKQDDDGYWYSDDKSNVVAIMSDTGVNFLAGTLSDPALLTTNMKKGNLYLDNYENLELLVVGSGINVEQPFNGLVFSESGIAVNAPINSTTLDNGFIEIMHSYCTFPNGEIRYLYEFFRNLNMVGEYEEGSDGSGYLAPGVSEDDAKVNWKPNDLVYYENWERY